MVLKKKIVKSSPNINQYKAEFKGFNSTCEITIDENGKVILYDGLMYIKLNPPFEKGKTYIKLWSDNIQVIIDERRTDNP